MKEINLKLSVEDANLILEGLGQLPFVKVYSLIARIQEQARLQLNGAGTSPEETAPSAIPTIGGKPNAE